MATTITSRRTQPVILSPVLPTRHRADGGDIAPIADGSNLHRCSVCEQGYRKITVTK